MVEKSFDESELNSWAQLASRTARTEAAVEEAKKTKENDECSFCDITHIVCVLRKGAYIY